MGDREQSGRIFGWPRERTKCVSAAERGISSLRHLSIGRIAMPLNKTLSRPSPPQPRWASGFGSGGSKVRESTKDWSVVSAENQKRATLQSWCGQYRWFLIRDNPLRGEGLWRVLTRGFRVHSPCSFFSATAA